MSDNPAPRLYDPARHDSQVMALFHDRASADRARSAVLAAGVPAAGITIMEGGGEAQARLRHPVQDLFVPEADSHDYHHALGRGHALLIVHPATEAARAAVVRALEQASPLDVDQHGSSQPGATAAPREINHANLSRADLHGRAVGGHDEVMLDMTGQKMVVRSLSESEQQAAPFAPAATPQDRPVPPPVSPAPAPAPSAHGTSYTYGVPAEVAREMSPEDQVMAQPHSIEVHGDTRAGGSFFRTVGEETRAGWRENHAPGSRVRSYVTERPTDRRA